MNVRGVKMSEQEIIKALDDLKLARLEIFKANKENADLIRELSGQLYDLQVKRERESE